MRRTTLFLAVLAGALLVPAGPASAHGGEGPDATAYRTEVTGLSSAQPGLTVRVVEAGARLELVNGTGRTIEVLGYQGEPYLEVRPDGTYENVNSPATYTNQTLDGDTPVPAGASPTAAPQWRRVSTGTTARWHDQRIRWLDDGLPPQAQADPSRSHQVLEWVVPLRDGVRTLDVRGTVTWEPPPPAWLWWVGALALGAGLTALGRRRARLLGPVALAAGTITLGYAVTRMSLGAGGQSPAIVAAVLAVAAGVLTLRGRTPFLLALAGALLTVFGGLADAGVLAQAVVPFPGPSWLARAAVLVAIGAGVAMAATGVLRLRAAPLSSVHD
ncbi:hypothetical protein [Actinoplanes auranticolor]|uniref:LPXTG-motif cell wall-anchored protein n=1 Tax=Actinoplanes auranticolor TaxID=47988 RepID=A0A919VQX0_9ACTN|nr:hypothetical protein [Actinoplanes auranticolor]GIM75384.1 hypothetical protein Aau02nite_65630 [Actinoplanes auranticolor]